MNYKPHIAVCILFFNKLNQTIECVESFIPSGVNIYVLNNGSEERAVDKFREFSSAHKNIIFIEGKGNIGVSAGRNMLIAASKEEWLFFVDNDIIIKDTKWIDVANIQISKLDGEEVLIPLLYNIHEKQYNTRTICKLKDGRVEFATSLDDNTNMFPGGAAIIKRSLFERLGVYDENIFVGFEDFEVAIRGIKTNNVVRAKFINDIELIHDHRFNKTLEDKNAASKRYDYDTVRKSHEIIARKHNVLLEDNFEGWLKEQKSILTKRLSFYPIIREFRKIRSFLLNKMYATNVYKMIKK